MKWSWLNNDTVALFVLGIVAIIGAVTMQGEVVAAAIGAVGGYIGSKASEKISDKKLEKNNKNE